MELRRRARLAVECLEVRWCPSAMGQVVNGSLIVTDDTTADLKIMQTDVNTFHVEDGGADVGSFSGVTNDVRVGLTGSDNTLAIDLQGHTTPGDIKAMLPKGNNTVSVANGVVANGLTVVTGAGNDTIRLGGPSPIATPAATTTMTASLTVNHGTFLTTGGGAGDVVSVVNSALKGGLGVISSTVSLDGASLVRGSAILIDNGSGATVNIDGKVTDDLTFWGSAQADTLKVSSTAVIGDDLFATLNGGSDTAALNGKVGSILFLDGQVGNDTVTVGGSVGFAAAVLLGHGNNTATITGTIGTRGFGYLFVYGGAGNDTVNLASTAEVRGVGWVNLGPGDDTFVLQNRTDTLPLVVDGGAGNDTFKGNKSQLKFTPLNFETFLS